MLMEHDRGSKDKINESSTVSYLRPLPEGGCLKKLNSLLRICSVCLFWATVETWQLSVELNI